MSEEQPTRVVDAQVHVYNAESDDHPWATHLLPGPPEVTAEQMVGAMASAGVDAAVIVSPGTIYRFDPTVAFEAARAHPDRYRTVVPVDPTRPDAGDRVRELQEERSLVGVRLMLWGDVEREAALRARDFFSAVDNATTFVSLLCTDPNTVSALVRSFPETRFVLDHFGLRQPMEKPVPSDILSDVHKVLALAEYPNLAVKLTAGPSLSAGPFPYVDAIEVVHRYIGAFGVERCAWGTDWTRTGSFASYREGVEYVQHARLSQSELARLTGGTIADLSRWDLTALPY